LRVRRFVDALDFSVDPAKAERFFYRILVSDAGPPRFLLVVKEPDFVALAGILAQPDAPAASILASERFRTKLPSLQ